jgi:DNA-binding beta-propeller fold protein YncE
VGLGQALRAGIVVLCLLLAVVVIVIPDSGSAGAAAATAATTVPSLETATSTGGPAPVAPPTLATIPGTGEETGGSEIERRLALPRFTYVGETDMDSAQYQQGGDPYSGAAAFIDSETDTLIARPQAGSSLQDVAASPDGQRVYMTDAYEPVLHVFDADSMKEILAITLPGVEASDPMALSKKLQDFEHEIISYDLLGSSSSGVACTPDGAWVLVGTSAGLQVVDTATDQVVRTLPDLPGGEVAVSFDGKRAYVTSRNWAALAPRTYMEWLKTFMEDRDCRLVCIDLQTWEILTEIQTGTVASIAVKPDDSQVFFSETYDKRVRVVDALTLEDLWSVSTEPSFSIGLGVTPNGTKAYVVCSADQGVLQSLDQGNVPTLPKAEDYFCGVIDTQREEMVKRIPLEAY